MLINVTKLELETIILNLWMHRKSDVKTNELYESTRARRTIDKNNMQTPIIIVSRLPILSESEEANNLISIVETT